jgi:hypothetical protein
MVSDRRHFEFLLRQGHVYVCTGALYYLCMEGWYSWCYCVCVIVRVLMNWRIFLVECVYAIEYIVFQRWFGVFRSMYFGWWSDEDIFWLLFRVWGLFLRIFDIIVCTWFAYYYFLIILVVILAMCHWKDKIFLTIDGNIDTCVNISGWYGLFSPKSRRRGLLWWYGIISGLF